MMTPSAAAAASERDGRHCRPCRRKRGQKAGSDSLHSMGQNTVHCTSRSAIFSLARNITAAPASDIAAAAAAAVAYALLTMGQL